MQVYVVKEGDTLSQIAQQTGSSVVRLVQDNVITNPENLLPGQTIVVLNPAQTYTVLEGDTLESIAEQFNISTMQLLQNNPIVSVNNAIFAGQTLTITLEGEKLRTVDINGFVYPFVDLNVLRRTLPYLTYLTIFTYGFTETGELVDVEDEEIIALCQEFNVVPVMLLAPMTPEGNFNNELANALFINEAAQDTLIANIITTMNQKGYGAIDLDFEFIKVEDAPRYVAFVNKLNIALQPEGFEVSVDLAPKIADDQPGLFYEGHDFAGLGAAADEVLVMTYEWGYTYGRLR